MRDNTKGGALTEVTFVCKKNGLLYSCFVVRRVVVLGIARGRLNIRFGHCRWCAYRSHLLYFTLSLYTKTRIRCYAVY